MLAIVGTVLGWLAMAVDLATGLVVAFAVAEALARVARHSIADLLGRGADRDAVRRRLGEWLALALELALASDIIRTALAPTWDDLGKLAAIMAIRTVLNYFLGRELAGGPHLTPRVRREAA
ncbi:MAG: DUF1622 domain-containing protein [Gemmatimonadales bacterium]